MNEAKMAQTRAAMRAARMIEDAQHATVYGNQTNLEAAAYGAARLIADISTGETNEETAAGSMIYRAETFTLSGGGPGSDITFIIDEESSEPVEAFYTYYDGGRTATVRLDRADAIDTYLALTGLATIDSE